MAMVFVPICQKFDRPPDALFVAALTELMAAPISSHTIGSAAVCAFWSESPSPRN